jgi:hypothetical protein
MFAGVRGPRYRRNKQVSHVIQASLRRPKKLESDLFDEASTDFLLGTSASAC